MRSARVAIFAAVLVLILLPLAFLGVAYGYERWLLAWYESRLAAIAERLAHAKDGELLGIATQTHVWARRLDAVANPLEDSGSGTDTLSLSPLGGLLEAIAGRAGWTALDGTTEALTAVEQALGPLADRPEVQAALAGRQTFRLAISPSGRTELFMVAAPGQGGGAVYVLKGSRLGVRRLFQLRAELLKLAGYQVVFALILAILLVRWLVRPLETLALDAGHFPVRPLAGPELLSRRDEVGQLARALTVMAASLEERRRAAVGLAADIAHEFKNPLATIAAAVDLLASTVSPTEEKKAFISTYARDAIERLRSTTDELLSAVRLEETFAEAPREFVHYAAFVEGLLDEYRRDQRYAHLTFRAEVDDAVGDVRLAPAAWARLLRNLLDNAVVQPSSRPEVVVKVTREQAGLVTRVADFGPGVSAGNRDKVFRRFFSHRPEGVPPGTGLGLSIVQAVARAHGGDVTLEDTPSRPGATFRVVLPLRT